MGAIGKVKRWLTPEGLTLLEGWARDGLNDKEIANKMRVHISTFYDYKNRFPEFSEAIKKGKEIIDYEVENAFLKKTKGYNVSVLKNVKVKRTEYDKETGKKVCEYEELVPAYDEVHVPADTAAQIFWLKNRKPDKWREKDKETSNEEKGVVIIDDLPK